MESISEQEIPEYNRRLIQIALDSAKPGETVDVGTLPLLRSADGKRRIGVLFTVPKSEASRWVELGSPVCSLDSGM
jgi:hypothetical protein